MFWSECFVQTLFCVNVGANISGQCWRASPISLFGLQLWQGSLLWAKGPEYPGYWHDATAIEHVWGSVRWQALPFVQAFYSCPLGLGGRASLPCLWNTFQGNFGSESSALVSRWHWSTAWFVPWSQSFGSLAPCKFCRRVLSNLPDFRHFKLNGLAKGCRS